MRQLLLAVTLMSVVSCGAGGGSPSGPTPQPQPQTPQPQPQAVTLSGTVSETDPTAATRVAGATVTIIDGAFAGRSATTDASGAFQLDVPSTGAVTLRTRAADYVERTQAITPVDHQAVAIELDPVLQIVTTSSSAAISTGGGCPGYWDYDPYDPVCTSATLLNVHHAGTLTADLRWTDSNTFPFVQLFRSADGHPKGAPFPAVTDGSGLSFRVDIYAHTQYVLVVSKFGRSGDSAPPGTSSFDLTVTRPN